MGINKMIQIPKHFQNTGDRVNAAGSIIDGSEIYSFKSAASSAVAIPCKVDSNTAMPFENVRSLIDELHRDMAENEGLIEARSSVNEYGQRYIYYIKKEASTSDTGLPMGIQYRLNFNMEIDHEIWFILAYFAEAGMTGMREAVCLEKFHRETGSSFENNAGWFEDPYDPSFIKGLRMNYSEKEEWDDAFPEHPLSELRRFVRFVINSNPPEKTN